MMISNKEHTLFYHISRSHLYWGRKPANGLSRVLKSLKPGNIFLDPFCGGGTPIVSALNRGARVIASDLNPMAVFMSKVLIRPVSLFALKEAFEAIREDVADSICEKYSMHCPKCRKEISFGYLKWNHKDDEPLPEAVKVTCKYCGSNDLIPLSEDEMNRQLQFAAIQPKFWFPKDPICGHTKTKIKFFHELFTGRNLTSLAELWHAIEKIPSARCKEAMQYVFTAMLYTCSSMQMFSEKRPSSSRGWTVPGFYLPSMRQESNVWTAFENRFKTVLKSREIMNSTCKFVRISDSMEKFENSDNNAYIYETDFLKFSFPERLDVNHVFIDPPYNDDIDYIGFSAFWGSWLGMAFDTQNSRYPCTISVEDNSKVLLKLLLRIREHTTASCCVTLTCGSKKFMPKELLNDIISTAGYNVMEEIPILRNNFRKGSKSLSTDLYCTLGKAFKRAKVNGYTRSGEDLNELTFFVRAAAFLCRGISNPGAIIELADHFIKPYLRISLRQVDTPLIRSWTEDKKLNRKAYNRLAFIFIKLILSQDGYRIVSADTNQFDDSDISGYDKINGLPIPTDIARGADFVAENNTGDRIFFCFYDDTKIDILKLIAGRVFKKGSDDFCEICYLIVPGQKEMIKCRQANWADNWPRGFFADFNKLVKKAKEIDTTRFCHITTKSLKSDSNFRYDKKIEHFTARVIHNTPVGENGDPKYFLIRFRAPELKYVVPGQFVMIDTLPYDKRKEFDSGRSIHSLATMENSLSYKDIVDLNPTSFLKRPFSIHRTFYKNFKWDYLKNISLPATLASITHTVCPDEFEICYKIVEGGTGTKELSEIEQGSTFQVLGPLGKVTNVAEWRSDGIEEVHLIGGGVGMAPLMFFGQALKYYSFRVKAFIGIDRPETLYKAPFEILYIDDLRRIGFHDDDIYLSFEKKDAAHQMDPELLKINYCQGLVIHQYASYLAMLDRTDNILAVSCGPEPMLKALEKITSKSNIKMKVLLEKRMGCGIGVCMSCVCRTRKNNVEQYSRVCMEGPLFDSEDIVW